MASFAAEEAAAFTEQGGIVLADLLSLNEDEAYAFTKTNTGYAMRITGEDTGLFSAVDMPEGIGLLMAACVQKLQALGSGASLIVTLGSRGSVCYHRGQAAFLPAPPAQVVATGGAGDAFISGVICGLCVNLPLLPPIDGGPSALRLGASFARKSVEHKDTIVPTIGPDDIIESC